MNKHRVVGFIVVIALIVIVTEFLLNYRMQSTVATVETVQPPMPELVKNTDSIKISEPEAVSMTSNAIKNPNQVVQEQEEKLETVMPTASSSAVKTKPAKAKNTNSASNYSHAWVVQLASYTDQTHADNLVSKLRKNGFDAFSYPAVSHGKNYIRVNAGPVATSKAAKQLMAELSSKMKLKGYLVRYTPADDLANQ